MEILHCFVVLRVACSVNDRYMYKTDFAHVHILQFLQIYILPMPLCYFMMLEKRFSQWSTYGTYISD